MKFVHIRNSCLCFVFSLNLNATLVALWRSGYVPPLCSGYHYCSISLSWAWRQVRHRFKPCRWRVEDFWCWRSPKMVTAGNKVKRLSSVIHTTEQSIIIVLIIFAIFHFELRAIYYWDFIKAIKENFVFNKSYFLIIL